MAKSEGQKLKLLYLQDYLLNQTDEAHPVSVAGLIDFLAGKGIPAERKSIYADIQALQDFGLEICYRRGKNGGYYVNQRSFNLSELKLLTDAVLSSRFLTAGQSATLVRKLAALAGSYESELLRRTLVVAGRVKTTNEDAIANVEQLHKAIETNRQITFRYFDWDVKLKKKFRGKTYRVSPYHLLWDNENYYLIAHSQEHGLTHYRVDKMAEIQLTKASRVITQEAREFDPASYTREVFGMFRGERKRVKLRFENALASVVVDRFGGDILLIPDGKEHFTMTVDISLSPNFIGWLVGFEGRAAVVFPESAVEAYRRVCEKAIAALPEG